MKMIKRESTRDYFKKRKEGKDFLHSGLQCSPAALSINDAWITIASDHCVNKILIPSRESPFRLIEIACHECILKAPDIINKSILGFQFQFFNMPGVLLNESCVQTLYWLTKIKPSSICLKCVSFAH